MRILERANGRRTTGAAHLLALGAVVLLTVAVVAGGCSGPPKRHPGDVKALVGENVVREDVDFQPLTGEERHELFEEAGPRQYRIGHGDVLQVIGDTDFLVGFGETSKGDVVGTRVKPDGSIYLPTLGAVPAADQTVVGLQDTLREMLRKYKKGPIPPFVSVDVIDYRSQRFSVLGAVGKAGLYPVDGTTTLLEGLSQAGGVTIDADLESAYFVRDSKIMPISLSDLLLHGDMSRNVYMKHGDLIFVPPHSKARMAFVLGEVMQPGPVPFVEGHMTLVGALAAAGGIDPKYADVDEIRIFRGHWPNPRSFTLSRCEVFTMGDGIRLQQGDRVVVASRGGASAARTLELFSPFLRSLYDVTVSAAALQNLFGD